MAKKLYFVDSIYSSPENTVASVTLLSTELQEDEIARVFSFSTEQLKLRGFRGSIREGYYVYFDDQREDRPFTYGNRSLFAREQFKRYYELLEELSLRYIDPQGLNDNQSIRELSCSKTAKVVSFHVNVGHGNCSFVLFYNRKDYHLWAVDCSIRELGHYYRNNLDDCLDEIAKLVGLTSRHHLHINRFFLTHPHYDNFNGMHYLMNQGHIDHNTVCFINLYYQMSSLPFNDILERLKNLNVRFVEPLYQNNAFGIRFLHPECRIYRHIITAKPAPTVPNRVVGNVNDSSSAFIIELGDRSMFFPGDLEQYGFRNITCRGELLTMDYYAVSHHGSITGHPDISLRCHAIGNTCLSCMRNGSLSRAVLMGRNGAFKGIYSPQVCHFFSGLRGCLVFTEIDPSGIPNRFVELDWDSAIVHYYQSASDANN